MRFTYDQFTKFLTRIDLTAYRKLYSAVKIVEMDLPKNVQALDTIYSLYWENSENKVEPQAFEEFYQIYLRNCAEAIANFWKKSGFGKECDCFQKGLGARIYRTWASLITQIHAGFVAEQVFGAGNVEMSAELDHHNIDFRITHHELGIINIQVKNETRRPEFAIRQEANSRENGVFPIWYIVPKKDNYLNPHYIRGDRAGQLRDSLREFVAFNPEGTLDMLPNGFVVFTPAVFTQLEHELRTARARVT